MQERRKIRQAVKMLMMSPLYFRMKLAARRAMVIEFCRLHLSA